MYNNDILRRIFFPLEEGIFLSPSNYMLHFLYNIVPDNGSNIS